ncbi:hypothetical protein [Aurantimonas marianensis]|uniref:Uncharacterized protein n=1 Tax=Aurantimonas marianensis TaxID=2920428 RepID=A0A9X2HBL6_9HYPH|nr:hypothetical protein [Aurantimonas marianensis]MCP3055442.1 hypothetical protein [Aurantimonas marianensis]
MFRRLDQISVRQVLLTGIGLVAILLAIGLATRENVADKPYLTIAGSGFIFNYRVADAYYGFTAIVEKPVRNYSRIEASFEDPAGGPPFLVSAKLTPRSKRYGLRSPPLSGIEKDKPYRVTVRLVQNGDGAVLFEDAFTVASQISGAVVPPAPLTIGPGYARNPDLPDGWKAPAAGRD